VGAGNPTRLVYAHYLDIFDTHTHTHTHTHTRTHTHTPLSWVSRWPTAHQSPPFHSFAKGECRRRPPVLSCASPSVRPLALISRSSAGLVRGYSPTPTGEMGADKRPKCSLLPNGKKNETKIGLEKSPMVSRPHRKTPQSCDGGYRCVEEEKRTNSLLLLHCGKISMETCCVVEPKEKKRKKSSV